MAEANAIDRLVGFVNPSAALKRQKARLLLSQLRRYEGAAGGRRTDTWVTPGSSADAAAGPALARLRDRSRDLSRNNPYASRAVAVVVNNTVGTGILAQPRSRRSRARQERVASTFNAWARNPRECDHDGRNDFYGLQALVMRTVVESGECLVRRRVAPDNATVPLRLQVLEPDFLDTGKDGVLTDGSGYVRQGIEFNAEGRRVAYWLFTHHPGDSHVESIGSLGRSNRVPADLILHIYRQERPGQNRGVPWASSVVIRLRDFDDYSDAQLLKQKISACFTGFIVEPESPDAAMGGDLLESLEPGALEILPPGKDIRFASPPSTAEFDKFARAILLQIAAGYGITYEALTSDLSQTNFSSARLGWLEFQRNIEAWRWQMLIPQFLTPTWAWWTNAAEIAQNPVGDVTVDWTPPRRELIDPSKEIEATIKAVRAGLLSLPEALRQFGYDPDDLLTEVAESNARIDELKLILDSDPRTTNTSGAAQGSGSSEPSPGSDNAGADVPV
jgi:lambda family phage portal protein